MPSSKFVSHGQDSDRIGIWIRPTQIWIRQVRIQNTTEKYLTFSSRRKNGKTGNIRIDIRIGLSDLLRKKKHSIEKIKDIHFLYICTVV